MQLDLHIHTHYSADSIMKPEKIAMVAGQRGLDAIAITDHDEIKGAFEVQKYAREIGLEVIIGEEILTQDGEIIGLFLKEKISTQDPFDAIRQIKAQGGLAIMPHPLCSKANPEILKLLDALEGYNARHSKLHNVDDTKGDPAVFELARPYGLALVAGSDAHFYPEIGSARTIVEAKDILQARQAIIDGKTRLVGKKSSLLYFLASPLIRSVRHLINPVPEAREIQIK